MIFYLIVHFWHGLAPYQASLLEPWFVFCQNTDLWLSGVSPITRPDMDRISRRGHQISLQLRYEGKDSKVSFLGAVSGEMLWNIWHVFVLNRQCSSFHVFLARAEGKLIGDLLDLVQACPVNKKRKQADFHLGRTAIIRLTLSKIIYDIIYYQLLALTLRQ